MPVIFLFRSQKNRKTSVGDPPTYRHYPQAITHIFRNTYSTHQHIIPTHQNHHHIGYFSFHFILVYRLCKPLIPTFKESILYNSKRIRSIKKRKNHIWSLFALEAGSIIVLFDTKIGYFHRDFASAEGEITHPTLQLESKAVC